MKEITCCEKINMVNPEDKIYYDKHYIISLGISNALWYEFDVYANHEIQAFEELVSFLDKNDSSGLYDTYAQLKEMYTDEEIESDFLYVDSDAYFNSGYTAIKEIE